MALSGKEPLSIVIGIMTDRASNAAELPNPRVKTGGLHGIAGNIVVPIFLLLFERYSDWLNGTYGRSSTEKWPPTLNFARVIRNAFAHGSINFRNPSTQPVSWRGITYSFADNGRKIIGADIQLGEVIALMFDVDDALNEIGAPVL